MSMEQLHTEHNQTSHIKEGQTFVAVRTMDRRHLLSPSAAAPDLFDVPFRREPPSAESQMTGGMRAHHGIIVKTDHWLTIPENEPAVRGYASFLHTVVDYRAANAYTAFTPRDVRDTMHDLEGWSKDEDTFAAEERRMFRIKAELFHQVLNLFNGKTPAGTPTRHR